MNNVITFVIAFTALTVVTWLGIQLDLIMNGAWLVPTVNQYGANALLMSSHGITALYLTGYWWLALPLLLSLAAFFYKPI